MQIPVCVRELTQQTLLLHVPGYASEGLGVVPNAPGSPFKNGRQLSAEFEAFLHC